MLLDVCDVLYNAGVRGRDYRNIYKLSQRNNICVKTGAGMSEYLEAGELIGQGSVGGALYSQKDLDSDIDDMFKGSLDKFSYGSVRGGPVIFQDDIFRGSDNVEAVNAGNIKMDNMAGLKQLEFHPVKTCYVLMGTESQIKEIRNLIVVNPIVCGDIIIKEKEKGKWLNVAP